MIFEFVHVLGQGRTFFFNLRFTYRDVDIQWFYETYWFILKWFLKCYIGS
jgi:hypothetical protein